MTEQAKRTEIARALRQYADIIEQYEDVPLPSYGVYMTTYGATKEQLKAAAKAFPKSDKQFSGDSFLLKVKLTDPDIVPPFDAVDVTFNAARETVCTKRVTGTKMVSTRRATGYVDVVEEQDVVEWDCNEPLLRGDS